MATPTRTISSLAFLLCAMHVASRPAAASDVHSVMELYTSQGCSSCPPADVVAGRLTSDPSVVVLSFHVNYWDDLGWKDPYASQASTDRQYGYGKALRERSVFTPQVVINGTHSLVGSRESEIRDVVAGARDAAFPVRAALTKQTDGSISLSLSGPSANAEVWEVRYVRHAMTKIGAGENGGRSLETFNNVTTIAKIADYREGSIPLRLLRPPEDGLAVIIQAPSQGPILGAAVL